MTSARLLAMDFANPALLGGLALAALPILIHILSRRRFRRVDWGALRFLLQAERESRRRVRMEQWLLLALRVAGMLLLAAVFARPFLAPGASGRLGVAAPLDVVIDDSASLDYRTGLQTEFLQLRAAAQRLLDELLRQNAGGSLRIWLTSKPAEPWAEIEALDAAAAEPVRQKLSALTCSAMPARPEALVSNLAARLQTDARSTDGVLYVLSDLQRSEWAVQAPDSAFKPLRDMGDRAPRIVFVASGVGERANLALRGLTPQRPHVMVGVPAMFDVEIANLTRQPTRDLRLTLTVGADALPAREIEELAPGQMRRVPLEVTFAAVGQHELTVSLGDVDDYPLDNTVRLLVDVRESLRVLLVSGAPAPDPRQDEVFLARSALAPSGPLRSGIEVAVIDAQELDDTELERFDCVALCNLPAPGPSAAGALQKFVEGGGGLLIALGDRVIPADYNRALGEIGGVLPMPLGEVREFPRTAAGVRLVRLVEHPATAMLPEAGAESSQLFQVHAFVAPREVDPGAGENTPPVGRVLARFTDSQRAAALIEREVGRGRVLLFASALDLDWNDWPRAMDGSYVVTLLEWVQHLGQRSNVTGAQETGRPLRLALPIGEFAASALLQSPPESGDGPQLVQAQTDGEAGAIEFAAPLAARVGRYEWSLQRTAGGGENRAQLVNLAPAESVLARAGDAELRAALGALRFERLSADQAWQAESAAARFEIWPPLLLLLAAVLLCEQVLAWHFGRPTGHMPARSVSLGRS